MALGLGANLGDPPAQLHWALLRLETLIGPLQSGSLYRTLPHSPIPQEPYLNTAVIGHTALRASDLLAHCKRLELEAGRLPGPRSGPRPLDVDILLYGSELVDEPGLTIPHPRLLNRRFALAPLADVAADRLIPGTGLTVAQALQQVGQEDEVKEVGW